MTKKMYTFNIQVQVTLDDYSDEPEFVGKYTLPKELLKETKKCILGWVEEINEYTDGHFEDSVYEEVNVPVNKIYFCLE